MCSSDLLRHRGEDWIRCPERRPIELRRDEIVAALRRRERFPHELDERGPFRMKHAPRVARIYFGSIPSIWSRMTCC